jgi:hypothetical protein
MRLWRAELLFLEHLFVAADDLVYEFGRWVKRPHSADNLSSVNTIILAALDVLKQTPQLDEVVHVIVAAPTSVLHA